MESRTAPSVVMMALAASLWGFSGYFSRHIMDQGYSAFEVTAVRSVLSVLILFVLILVFRRSDLRIRKRDVWFFVFFGFMKLCSDLFLFMAQDSVTLSLSTTLQMMSPVYVVIITVTLYSAKVSRHKAAGLVMALVGCILVTGVLFDAGTFSTMGLSVAFLSGVSYGIYTLGAKMSIIRGYTAESTLFWMFLVPAGVSVLLANPIPLLSAGFADTDMFLLILGLAVLITLVPYWLQTYSMRNLSADSANIIGVLEAAVAAIVGFVVYDEGLTVLNIIGMFLIFAAIFVMGRDTEHGRLSRNP